MQTYSIIFGCNTKKSTIDVDLSNLGSGMNISRNDNVHMFSKHVLKICSWLGIQNSIFYWRWGAFLRVVLAVCTTTMQRPRSICHLHLLLRFWIKFRWWVELRERKWEGIRFWVNILMITMIGRQQRWEENVNIECENKEKNLRKNVENIYALFIL